MDVYRIKLVHHFSAVKIAGQTYDGRTAPLAHGRSQTRNQAKVKEISDES